MSGAPLIEPTPSAALLETSLVPPLIKQVAKRGRATLDLTAQVCPLRARRSFRAHHENSNFVSLGGECQVKSGNHGRR